MRGSHRQAGIALAMKVVGVNYARTCGVDAVRTVQHAGNRRATVMNRRLGYVDADW